MSDPKATPVDFIEFDDRLRFEFSNGGDILTVTIAGVEHVLWQEQTDQLRDWLFAQGAEFADDL